MKKQYRLTVIARVKCIVPSAHILGTYLKNVLILSEDFSKLCHLGFPT